MNFQSKIARRAYRLALPSLKLRRSRPADQAPLFVIGSGRSGNTLVRRVLLASEQIYIPPETYVLGDLIEGWPQMALLPWRQKVWLFCAQFEKHYHFPTFRLDNLNDFAAEAEKLEPRTLHALILAFYAYLARKDGSKATRWGDKTPWNTYHLPAIGAMFPHARYVWLMRDGRDVALSYYKAGLYDSLAEAAVRWADANRACQRFERWCPHLYRLRYEDLVTDPEATFGALFAWSGLQFHPDMLESQPGVMGDVELEGHHTRVRDRISSRSVGQWRDKLGAAELGALPPWFWEQLRVLGYVD
ncbi:sulfotransferase [Ruegeria sp. 2012CJ41-6]|uniref:Sulfotransferase n=1 Tax=Ruegeria spongiae TaxID=2942209 RepID=A0ABT0Q6Y0_9RHOB|nr:sulfotransferase [Ruegeria spongiae]MCL6285631.1 sulfotransferase [Ruegeria spongiae]